MAAITVPNTFSNGTAADATAVNANFDAITDGLSDGTKDITVSAATINGALTANGAVTLGNATGDDITVTGRVAADFDPKTASTYDMGDATQLWKGVYANDAFLDRGAVGTPSHSFHADTDTGMWSSAANTLDLAAGGVNLLTLTTTAAVFNEAGADVDFRVEGDTEVNLLFVDASTDRVGIGTATPDSRLALLTAASGNMASFTNSANDASIAIICSDTSGQEWKLESSNDAKFRIREVSTTRLTIDTDGKVGIGTDSPGNILHVARTGSTGVVAEFSNSGGDTQIELECTNGTGRSWTLNSLNNGVFSIYDNDAAATRFSIATDGTLTASASNDISDARMKSHIEDLNDGLELVLQFSPKTYKKKTGSGRKNFGYTTQDMEKVAPSLVGDGMEFDGEMMKALHYNDIHAIHTRAIQQLNDKIEALTGLLPAPV